VLYVSLGLHKLFTYAQFAYTLETYDVFPAALTPLLAVAVPCVEVVLGSLLLVRGSASAAAFGLSVLTLAFVALKVHTILIGHVVADCGCWFTPTRLGPASVLFSAIIIGFLTIVATAGGTYRRRRPRATRRVREQLLSCCTVAVVVGLAWLPQLLAGVTDEQLALTLVRDPRMNVFPSHTVAPAVGDVFPAGLVETDGAELKRAPELVLATSVMSQDLCLLAVAVGEKFPDVPLLILAPKNVDSPPLPGAARWLEVNQTELQAIGAFAMSRVFLVTSDGAIVFRFSGYRTSDWPVVEEAILATLSGQAPAVIETKDYGQYPQAGKSLTNTQIDYLGLARDGFKNKTLVLFARQGCGSCQAAVDLLSEIAELADSVKVVLADVVTAQDRAAWNDLTSLLSVRRFMSAHGWRRPQVEVTDAEALSSLKLTCEGLGADLVLDDQGATERLFGLTSLPLFLVVEDCEVELVLPCALAEDRGDTGARDLLLDSLSIDEALSGVTGR